MTATASELCICGWVTAECTATEWAVFTRQYTVRRTASSSCVSWTRRARMGHEHFGLGGPFVPTCATLAYSLDPVINTANLESGCCDFKSRASQPVDWQTSGQKAVTKSGSTHEVFSIGTQYHLKFHEIPVAGFSGMIRTSLHVYSQSVLVANQLGKGCHFSGIVWFRCHILATLWSILIQANQLKKVLRQSLNVRY